MNQETGKLVFTAIFVICLVILYQRWELRNSAPPEAGDISIIAVDADIPSPTQELGTSVEDAGPSAGAIDGGATDAADARSVQVGTDWLQAEISEDGGNIVALVLKKHALSRDDDRPYPLLRSGQDQYYVRSGLIGEGLPNHRDTWRIVGGDRDLGGADEVAVTLRASTPAADAEKIYTFRRGEYLITVEHRLTNRGTDTLPAKAYYEIVHSGAEPAGYSFIVPTYFGPALYTDETKFTKIDFEDVADDDYPKKASDGWIGVIQRYFLSAWIPGEGEREYFLRELPAGGYGVGTILPMPAAAPGASSSGANVLYAGAEEQRILGELSDSGVAPGIDRSVDYGWLTFIAAPMFVALDWIHSGVGNWGVSIVLLTLLIKLVFFPLSAKSYRSMAHLRKVTPRLQQLRDIHGDNREALQRATIELYREEKINPLGGCWPILVQIPVFIALYWLLLGSVELRNAPFVLWITDLSTPDPWYVLPVLLGLSMVGQMRLNPTPTDPMQATLVKVMPMGFALFSIFFPSGLVVYWLVNTLLSISQQWLITRKMAGAGDGVRK